MKSSICAQNYMVDKKPSGTGELCDGCYNFDCYSTGRASSWRATSGISDSALVWMSKVACTGTESNIDQCDHYGWGRATCGSTKASVICSDDKVRLVGGRNSSYGRVELFHRSVWKGICQDDWENNTASVICRMLQFSDGVFIPAIDNRETKYFWLNIKSCTGNETDIDQCQHKGWGDQHCDSSKTINVQCLGDDVSLIYSVRTSLVAFNLRTGIYKNLITGGNSVHSLDIDTTTSELFFTDNNIFRLPMKAANNSLKGTEVVINSTSSPEGIAIDWIHSNLYWTDPGSSKIEVVNVQTKRRKTLFREDLGQPRAIVVNPSSAHIYWTDWGSKPRIEKAGMDGSQRTTIIDSDLKWPNGMAIDYTNQYLYWVDGGLHQIWRSDLNGAGRINILTDNQILPHPFGMALFRDFLYISDWNSKGIIRVGKVTARPVKSLRSRLSLSPMNLKVFHKDTQPEARDRCGRDNGGCSFLCLPSPLNTTARICACPDDQNLQADGKSCI